jgi:hypothetical protein
VYTSEIILLKKFPLVNGSFFLTIAINKYWVNVCLTNESQKSKQPFLRPIYHGSKKIKELIKNLPSIFFKF